MALSAGTRLDSYEVLGRIGAGGMGEVYRARDMRLGREVALKVLPDAAASDAERLKRFEREARSASSLSHPNIVTIYDIGEANGVSYIAMELVSGQTLRELLADGPLVTKKTLAIAAQVADGLARAHAAGIVHRDLKPENVMVTKDGLVKILDFGLAKLTQPELPEGQATHAPTVSAATQDGIVMGTVAYMSPEQALGKSVDFRSDQFALGSMLYEMVAGRKAFARASAPETMAAIIRQEPEPLPAATPAPLCWIVERCLAKDPDERYGSTRDLARDLERLRQGITDGSLSGVAAPIVAGPRPSTAWRYGLSALAVLAAAVAAVLALRRPPAVIPDYHAVTFRRGTVDSARFAPDGKTILYSAAFEGRPYQLFTTRVDSTESASLPLPTATLGAVSSSGMLAVSLLHDADPPTLAEVSLAGGAPRELVRGVVLADWSPDGTTLAVVREGRIEAPIGKVIGKAREGYQFVQIRFSPDGREIAALERRGGAAAVVVYGLDGSRKEISTGWGYASGLAWHPLTGEVWFSPRDLAPGSVLMLFAASPSTGKSRLVARPPGIVTIHDIARDGRVLLDVADWHQAVFFGSFGSPGETNLGWLDFSSASDISADGKTVLLGENGRGGGTRGSIYLRRTDGSPATRLGDGVPYALSPDGKWVIAMPGSTLDRLLLLPTGAGEPKVLQTPGMNYGGALWIPGTRRLLIEARSPERPSRVYVQDVDGGALQPLTPEGEELVAISPDGRFAATLHLSDSRILLYPIEGGEATTVPGLGAGDYPMRFDDTGRALLVASGDFTAVISRVDVATGRREKVGEISPSDRTGAGGLSKVVVTPDGKTYAYTLLRRLSTLYVATGLK